MLRILSVPANRRRMLAQHVRHATSQAIGRRDEAFRHPALLAFCAESGRSSRSRRPWRHEAIVGIGFEGTVLKRPSSPSSLTRTPPWPVAERAASKGNELGVATSGRRDRLPLGLAV